MKKQIIRYLAAMNATAFDAGIHCLKITLYGSGGAALTGHSDWVTVDPLKKIGLLFAANFFAAIISYLDAHPIATAFKFVDADGTIQTVQKVVPIPQPLSPATTPEQNKP